MLHIFADMTTPLSHTELISLAEQYGTPLYVYHAEKIKEQYDKLHHRVSKQQHLFFLCLQGTYQYQYLDISARRQCGLQFNQ